MPVSASLRSESRKPGIAGFQGRAAITDDLITRSLENKLATEKYKTDVAAKTDLATGAANIAARERESALGKDTTLKQEGMQQEGMTARQKITEAGSLAVEKLRGITGMARIEEAGEQARKTKKTPHTEESLYLELLEKDAKAGSGQGQYSYRPGKSLTIEDPVDIEDYLNIE